MLIQFYDVTNVETKFNHSKLCNFISYQKEDKTLNLKFSMKLTEI